MRVLPASSLRAEPNVTPLIDVMLVLLIVFMVVTPMLLTGVPATPPTGRHLADHPDDAGDTVIGIDASGGLYLDKRPVAETALAERLRHRFDAASSDRVVYLRADRAVPYERVQRVMTLASTNGARVVGLIATRPVNGEW